ncbi:ketosamine-3-kinase-like isoform X2 [Palaemon carinicauda]|uniref:ketosamine-3-kinase-like isoform X2 n=1 Tax=Palaemon carinicauda TaxID=392227 RepID=UPI0035B61525
MSKSPVPKFPVQTERVGNWRNITRPFAMTSKMYDAIREALGTSRFVATGQMGGGCINEGEVYEVDHGKVYLKRSSKEKARAMFDGEFESLKAMKATGTVKVPTPHIVVDNPTGGAVLCMEYLDMRSLNRHTGMLGKQLAELHLYNIEEGKKAESNDSYVGQGEKECQQYTSKFGFHIDTCCGYLSQDNSWCDDWVDFFARKLQQQLTLVEKDYGDREARELWSKLQLKLPEYFKGIEVKPSLLHGDLWSGNASEIADCPVIFDPASFYGHHEFDLAIAGMFGGFSRRFWDEYHKVIPKAPGWNERHKLYQLFHNLNHWNHFGTGYRSGSLHLMRTLSK